MAADWFTGQLVTDSVMGPGVVTMCHAGWTFVRFDDPKWGRVPYTRAAASKHLTDREATPQEES